jgi:hypothetical protein
MELEDEGTEAEEEVAEEEVDGAKVVETLLLLLLGLYRLLFGCCREKTGTDTTGTAWV